MRNYKYKAIDSDGKVVHGNIEAVNEVELDSKLCEINFELITCKEVKSSNAMSFLHRIQTKDILMLCIHLSELERSGVPLLDSLLDLRDSLENPKMKEVIHSIYEEVKNGKMLSEALKKYPKTFDSVFTSLIAAGEKTGRLDEILLYLVDHLKWNMDLEDRIRKASYYPIGMMIMMCVIIGGMMVFVVPEIMVFLAEQELSLPMSTQIMIVVSDFFVNRWDVLLTSIFSFYISYKLLKKYSSRFRYYLSIIKLNTPFIGSITQKIEMARFCRFFAITYSSGIDIIECLKISSDVVQNEYLRSNINRISRYITNGIGLTQSMKIIGRFPNLVIRLFGIGEESGNLSQSLKNVNIMYDREINDGVDMLIGAIKPTMMFVIGLLVAWIAVSIFGPIYGNLGNI